MKIFIHLPQDDIERLMLDVIEGNLDGIQYAISLLDCIQKLRTSEKMPGVAFLYSKSQKADFKRELDEMSSHRGAIDKKVTKIGERFLRLLEKVYSAAWDDKEQHSTQYNYLELRDTDTILLILPNTLAEAAEQREPSSLLLLQQGAKSHAHVLRCQTYNSLPKLVSIPIVCQVDEIEALSQELLAKERYDDSSTIPPADNQTILRDKELFEATAINNVQGRKVYRHKETDLLFYVDNLHYGKKAHLEVFDSLGKTHLGEADIRTGKVDQAKKDDKKKAIV
jgi:hypothetical protein